MRAFGWHAIEIDGHDVEAVDRAYAEASRPRASRPPSSRSTVKGKGVAWEENKNGFHGKPLDDPDDAIRELGGDEHPRIAHVRRARSRQAAPFPNARS